MEQVLRRFEKDVLGNLNNLEKGMIHGDINEQNLIVDSGHESIGAVIDFGDSQQSCLIFELMIVLCYMIIHSKDIEAGRHLVEGYLSVKKLSDLERQILKTGVCTRLCQSLVFGAHSHLRDPHNDYIMITSKHGWKILRKLWTMDDDEVMKIWNL